MYAHAPLYLTKGENVHTPKFIDHNASLFPALLDMAPRDSKQR